MLMLCIYGTRVSVCTYIHKVGLSVACSDVRAIPEPELAEQQQCSPAFLCIYTIIADSVKNNKTNNIKTKNTLNYYEKLKT